jgi:hypothetical protein
MAHRQLTQLRGGTKQAEYLLDLPDVIVGRGRSANIRLDDNKMVSRQHAVVRARGNGHVVEDLGGANGTFVNGQRVESQPLRIGDRIVLGEDTLRYDAAARTARSLRGSGSAPAAGGPETGENEPVQELSMENVEAAEDLADVREARKQSLASAADWEDAGEGKSERTAVASKEDLERLLREMKLKSGPHLRTQRDGKPEILPLLQSPLRVGHGKEHEVKLPGSRWLLPGKLAASFVQQTGTWCVVPESPYWRPVLVAGEKIRKIRMLQDGDAVDVAGVRFEFRKGEQR